MANYLTVLTATPTRPVTKTFAAQPDGKINSAPYPDVAYWNVSRLPISDVQSLGETIKKLPHAACVVRGAPVGGLPEAAAARNNDNFIDEATHWVCIDVDNFPLGNVTLADAPGHIKSLLPTEFQPATTFYQYSASAGLKPDTVSIHYWFWLNEPVPSHVMKLMLEHHNTAYGSNLMDMALFQKVQPHYTAPPVFVAMSDPLEALGIARSGYVKGLFETVSMGEQDIKGIANKVTTVLELMGDDKSGFHQILASASWHHTRIYGASTSAKADFKLLARAAIDAAYKSPERTDADRYKSDDFLDKLLTSAALKVKTPTGETSSEMSSRFWEYVFIREDNAFINLKNNVRLVAEAFDKTHVKYMNGAKGRPSILFAHGPFPQADITMKIIGEEPNAIVKFHHMDVLNTWKGRRGIRVSDYDIAPFMRLIDRLTVDQEPIVIKTLLNFIACFVRYPGKKIAWAPIITGKQGIGKSTLATIMSKVLYDDGVRTIMPDKLESQFNSYLDCELLIIEEANASDSHKVQSTIKAIIGNSSLEMNVKFKQEREVPNHMNVMVFSNSSTPLRVERGDRRFLVIESKANPMTEEETLDIRAFIDNPNVADHLTSWSYDHELAGFKVGTPPPVTAAKLEMIADTSSPMDQLLADGVAGWSWPLQHDAVMLDALLYAITTSTRYTVPTIKQAIKSAARRGLFEIVYGSGIQKTLVVTRRDGRSNDELHNAANSVSIGTAADYYSQPFREKPRPVLRLVPPSEPPTV